jgi:ATP-binding cassette subfamily F protein 3
MLSVNSLTVNFGATYLFDEICFVINPKERIGLVGKNGAGKSTLMKIMAGWQNASSGSIDVAKGTTISYLPQDLHVNIDKTVLEETKTAFIEIQKLNAKVDEWTHLIETTDPNDAKYMDYLIAQSEAIERLGVLGADTIEADTIKILEGLGFNQTDFDRPTAELSGGWRMRIELAKILLQKPDVILLDEPTNHLDIESIQWLEMFFKTYEGVIVLVSHDKTFLDNVTNRTIEIANQTIYDFKTNYSQYVIDRKVQKELQLATKKNQEKEIERTQLLIDKYRAKANKASFAQSLIKKLDRMEIIEVDEDSIATMKFRFPEGPRSGLSVVEAKKLSKFFGARQILNEIDLLVERGEKIAFVGKNGMGKTTMGKMIVGEEDFMGELNLGTNVNIGYYAQHQAEKLDDNQTVLETIEYAMKAGADINARSLLGAFLFGGEAVTKKVKILSGGEKSRLSLAKLMLEDNNLLILDEPTNHLDMISISVLKQALENYNGTTIIISHDRDFLAGLTSKVFEFNGGKVTEFLGDINYFLSQKKLDSIRDFEVSNIGKEKKIPVGKVEPNSDKDKENIRIKKAIEKIEKDIATIELSKSSLEVKMAQITDFKSAEAQHIQADYKKVKNELKLSNDKWEELINQIED